LQGRSMKNNRDRDMESLFFNTLAARFTRHVSLSNDTDVGGHAIVG